MIMVFIETTMKYFWLNSKVFLKKLTVMTDITLTQTVEFVNLSPIIL